MYTLKSIVLYRYSIFVSWYCALSVGYLFSSNIHVDTFTLEHVLSPNRTVIQGIPCSNKKFVMMFILQGCCVGVLVSISLHSSGPLLHQPNTANRIETNYYQLLAHLTFRLAISVSSSSLAKTRIAAMTITGERAMTTLLHVHKWSRAVSISIIF